MLCPFYVITLWFDAEWSDKDWDFIHSIVNALLLPESVYVSYM